VPVVASAGNNCGSPVLYPAAYSSAYSNVIAVSATNHNDVITEYSNVGPQVNVAAPGGHGTTNVCQTGIVTYESDDVYSTTPNYPFNIQIDHPEVTQSYGYLAGTSMAAPHVAGTAALMLSINADLSASLIRNFLQQTADDKGPSGFDNQYGNGRLNAYQALLLTHAYSNKSMSAGATAYNNGRRLVKTSDGKYHLVFESGITSGGNVLSEIFYRRSNVGGTSWDPPIRLSAGNEQSRYPSLAERGGKLYVVWQRYDGSSHDIHFRKSTDGGSTWATSTELASNVGANAPLPVVISPATDKLTVVYRTSSNLGYKLSNDSGTNWTTGAVPSTGANDYSPTLAPTITGSGSYRSALVWARSGGNGTIYYRYYKNGPDSTGWNSTSVNLTQIVPGTYFDHTKPSLAPSGTAGSTTLHAAWEARQGSAYLLFHRKATNWGNWPNAYYVTIWQEMRAPSITGLVNNTAEMLSHALTGGQTIFKMHYNGSSWGAPVSLGSGANPSVSAGNTTAKYVWTSGSTAPYQINTSAETLSKTGAGPLSVAYHRSIAVLDTTAGAWLDVRLDKLSVKTKAGGELAIPFVNAKEDSLTLTPTNAFANLASPAVSLPADAESLFVLCQVSGQTLSAIKQANPIDVEIILTEKSGATIKLPVINTAAENLSTTLFTLSAAISAFAGGEVSLSTQVKGIATNKSSLIAGLGHIYEVVETSLPKTLEEAAGATTPKGFALQAYPNPFNPSTQIRFAMREDGLATLRLYNLYGQAIRELLNESRASGEHTVTWDGRDDRGTAAASGIYFIRFEAGNAVKVGKVLLVR
ncbi:MAG: S8 family serine peptidase, partial [bacterium]